MSNKYIIMNRTDGITATPDVYTSKKTAQARIDQIRENFKKGQGYYFTNSRERISPDDVWYEIVKIYPEPKPIDFTMQGPRARQAQ